MKVYPMEMRDFLRLYVAMAFVGAASFWPVACSSMLLKRGARHDPVREAQTGFLLKTEPGSYLSTGDVGTTGPTIKRGWQSVTGWRDSHFTPWRGDYLAASHLCSLPVRLIAAVVKAESGGDPWALSPSGARGLMQVLPSTAAELGQFNLWIPSENLVAGSCALQGHLEYRKGDVKAALADYHAGRWRARTSAATLAYAESIMENAQ